MRANSKNLRKLKDELMRAWKITEEQWSQLLELALKRSWKDFHTRGHPSFARFEYMDRISKVIDGYGPYSLHPCVPDIDYVNMGDTYVWTLYLRNGKLYAGCWGDLVEKYCTCNKEAMT